MSEERFDRIDGQLQEVNQRFDARIAAIADNTSRLEAKMDRGFADLKETIGRRLDLLEAAVRQHSTEIERLKQGRG